MLMIIDDDDDDDVSLLLLLLLLLYLHRFRLSQRLVQWFKKNYHSHVNPMKPLVKSSEAFVSISTSKSLIYLIFLFLLHVVVVVASFLPSLLGPSFLPSLRLCCLRRIKTPVIIMCPHTSPLSSLSIHQTHTHTYTHIHTCTYIHRFIKELDGGLLERSQLGLGHSYSRAKVSKPNRT